MGISHFIQGYNKAVDWWALGVLIYEMAAGYPPFFADQPIQIYEKIVSGKVGEGSVYFRKCSSLSLQNLVFVWSRCRIYWLLGSEQFGKNMGKVCNVYFLSTDVVSVILKIKVLKICSLPSDLKCKLLNLQTLWYYVLLCLDKNGPTTINNCLAVCLICLATFFSRNIFAAFEKL